MDYHSGRESIYALQGSGTLEEVYKDLADKEDVVFSHWKEEVENVIVQSIEEVLNDLSY